MKPPAQPPPPPNQPEQPPPQPVMPVRELVTEHQISGLLAITQALQVYLLVPDRDIDGTQPLKLDGEAHLAAVSTFVKVCQKIEDLLRQEKRWDTSTHDLIYENIEKFQKNSLEVQQEQIALFRSQRKVAERLDTPSYSLKPTIQLIEGGEYIAYWGDLKQQGSAIIGKGKTPREAMEDFDRAWERTPMEQLMGLLEPEPPVDNPLPVCDTPAEPKPKRKKKSDDQ